MQIVGHKISKISGNWSELEKGFTISINVDVNKVEMRDIFPGGEKKSGIAFDFSFGAEYGKESAALVVEGTILGLGEEKELKKILKDWKANKLSPETDALVKNRVLTIGYSKGIPLAESLNLPLPLRLPRFAPTSETKK